MLEMIVADRERTALDVWLDGNTREGKLSASTDSL